jgi:ribonuclease D
VAHLLPMYDLLRARLEGKGRYPWALAECAELGDIARYRIDERRAFLKIPGAARMNRRELGVLSELVKLRDRIARERDLPVKYVLPDDVVGGLAMLRPKHLDDLAQLRRLDAGVRRQLGSAILEAIARGESLDESELPEKPNRPLGANRDTLVALLGVVAGEIARDADLPTNLLVPRSALERVAREVPRDRESFERALALQAWRFELVGDPLWRLLSGQAGLAIEGYADGDPKIRLSHDGARK